ncbi:saposin B domain-containing protein [Cavenderia fasciculata]|uniref:Saposin B domain-containing protein n=1 Tax=Cavenderia fasciculata TaxID=261658 RepID=F4Q7A9_CACFS|nr:saposin B domain-containing protein [Cavenderia fasciculata]EGG16291.1 saposin B domain-containing protein [Cavenderia fasciculata]|eukprot:XP_004354675.1 saposin B domain-containing protein [Cavenderia fasciculata]
MFFVLVAITAINAIPFKINNGLGATPVECDLCQLTVNVTEHLIKTQNYTKEQVETELKKICNIVPANMTKECNLFMLLTAPLITDALFNGESSTELCTKYKLCAPVPSEEARVHVAARRFNPQLVNKIKTQGSVLSEKIKANLQKVNIQNDKAEIIKNIRKTFE